jgi:hypothetical protein
VTVVTIVTASSCFAVMAAHLLVLCFTISAHPYSSVMQLVSLCGPGRDQSVSC